MTVRRPEREVPSVGWEPGPGGLTDLLVRLDNSTGRRVPKDSYRWYWQVIAATGGPPGTEGVGRRAHISPARGRDRDKVGL